MVSREAAMRFSVVQGDKAIKEERDGLMMVGIRNRVSYPVSEMRGLEKRGIVWLGSRYTPLAFPKP